MNKPKIFIHDRGDYGRFYPIILAEVDGYGDIKAIAKPIVMETLELGDGDALEGAAQPSANLPREALQDLIDRLWMMGFRPKDAKDGKEVIAILKAQIDLLVDLHGDDRKIMKSLIDRYAMQQS